MTRTKRWYTSRTVWGIILAAAIAVGGLFGVQPATELPGWLGDLLQILALVVALVGRFLAEQRIR